MHDISYLVNQPNYVLLEPLKEPEELQIEHDKQNYWNISFYFAISKIITKSSTDRALMALYKERMTSIINTHFLEKEEEQCIQSKH